MKDHTPINTSSQITVEEEDSPNLAQIAESEEKKQIIQRIIVPANQEIDPEELIQLPPSIDLERQRSGRGSVLQKVNDQSIANSLISSQNKSQTRSQIFV